MILIVPHTAASGTLLQPGHAAGGAPINSDRIPRHEVRVVLRVCEKPRNTCSERLASQTREQLAPLLTSTTVWLLLAFRHPANVVHRDGGREGQAGDLPARAQQDWFWHLGEEQIHFLRELPRSVTFGSPCFALRMRFSVSKTSFIEASLAIWARSASRSSRSARFFSLAALSSPCLASR